MQALILYFFGLFFKTMGIFTQASAVTSAERKISQALNTYLNMLDLFLAHAFLIM